MAKRKLHGAALAAYNKKRGIGSGTRAIARRGSTAVVTRTRTVKVAAPRRRRRSGGGGGGGARTLRAQIRDLIGAGAYGFLTGDHNRAPQVTDMFQKLPTFEAIGAPASHGLLLHFLAINTSGKIRMAAGHLSHAALMHAAHNFGTTGGEWDQAIKLSGDDGGGDYLAGDIGPDDLPYDDDDSSDEQ
jgi:hypothetical protein